MPNKRFLKERFEEKFIKTNGCWIWTASRFTNGYGHFILTNRRKDAIAHRISYELYIGPIPKGMEVLHKCDNPPCVNPDHLSLGTQQDNIQDCLNKGRFAITYGHPKGSEHGRAKLTEDQVRAIRQDPRSNKEISHDYGLIWSHVSLIKCHRIWKHI